MDSLKKIILHHRSSHHAGHSGYAQLINYIHPDQVIEGQPKIPYRLAKLLSKQYSNTAGLYNSDSVYKNIELKRLIKKTNTPTIVHFLNGERDIRRLIMNPKVAYSASFHKPPSVLKKQIANTRYLKQLNGVVCVGDNQVSFIQEWLGLEKVRYIPHGIDTTFFTPGTSEKRYDRPKILFVGQHLRDFETFNEVTRILLDKLPDLWVDVILRKEYQNKILKDKRVAIHSGVSDDQLRTFYQEATVLFLPLLDATACNSLLEALACGLPIVTSNVGGVGGYLQGTSNTLVRSGEVDEFVHKLQNLLDSPSQLNGLMKENVLHARKFDWRTIGQLFDIYFQEIMSDMIS